MLVLFLWDSNKFYLKAANSIIHLLEVLLHPFILALIVAVNLTGYNLGIAVYNHIFKFCCFCQVQSCYPGFILCFIIGRREIQMDLAFDLIPFRSAKYHTSSTCLLIGGSICVDAPL